MTFPNANQVLEQSIAVVVLRTVIIVGVVPGPA